MKQKFLSISIFVLLLTLLCGCGKTVSTSTISEDLILQNPKNSVVGTWSIPEKAMSITCGEDGTYTSTNADNQKGTYTYLSENQYFTISDILGQLEYVTFVNEKNEEVLMAAILPDVMIVYDIKNENEQYYFRKDRQPVPLQDITGMWLDATGNEYTMELQGNSTYFSNDEKGTFSFRIDGDTTYLTTSLGDDKTEYIVLRYQDHLFLYRQDGTMFLYNKQK